ncbi:hypothetical protein [Leptospira noguchii]|uniref:hypothetical protein n=1 Tax=Leptospira noguchii TaxID=28182 RepID=UPI000773FB05|nr:hypothetical protein [Leptospira noguchii]
MKYSKDLICFFCGLAIAFFLSFLIETLNPEPHEGALLFESFAWYLSVFVVGICGIIAGRDRG